MGNVFRKKRVVTEELENLSAQMKSFRTDIEATFQRRRSVLWYLTVLVFFTTSVLSAYIFATYPKREHQIVFIIGVVLSGIFAIYSLRRLVNSYYDYMMGRKRKNLDSIIERKKEILENVKETETFKVAKEILEKYDDEQREMAVKPSSHPSTPSEPQKIVGPQGISMQGRPMGPAGRPIVGGGGRANIGPPMPRPATSLGNINQIPPNNPMIPPPRRLGPPPRPFVKESKTAVDKVVDYFFGDGPNNRLALICCNCNGHNGMALPGEYEYLAFMCYICGQFNPAKKLRPISQRPSISMGREPSGLIRPSESSTVPGTGNNSRSSSPTRAIQEESDDQTNGKEKETVDNRVVSSEKNGTATDDDFEAVDAE